MAAALVAREHEVAVVRAALSAATPGLVVYGEAGVGKTTLVRAALDGQPGREGGCLATLAWAPYLALRRAFGDDLPASTWTGDSEHVAEQVERSLGSAFLHIDDVQWADPGTRQVLVLLAGRCRLVTTIRRGDPGAAEALAQLDRAGLPRLDLEPLHPGDAAALVQRLRPRLAPHEVASLVERSGGNPLLLEELADADADIATLHRAVLARCRQLPDTQLDDLALLALAGQPLPAGHLDDPDALVESGIVEVGDGIVWLRHALIGEVIDDLLATEREHRCHRRLAELLTHPGEQARHLLAVGDLEAAHARAMSAVASATTPGERIAHLETAARCLDPVDGAEFRLQAAEAATEVDLLDVAAELIDGLPERPELRHRVARLRYARAMHLGDDAALPALVDAALAVAAPGSTEEVLSLMDRTHSILISTGDPLRLAEAVTIAERAVRISEEIDAERSSALKARADALYISGDERWREAMPEALRHARAEGNVAREWRIANNWISALQVHGPIADGLALAEEMVSEFDELHLVGIRRNFEFRRFDLLLNLAAFDAIIAGVPALLDTPGTASVMEVDLVSNLAEAEIWTGRIDEGVARLTAGPAISSERGRIEAHRILAEMYVAQERPELAAEQLAAFDAYDVGTSYQIMIAPARALTALGLDNPTPPRPEDLPEDGMFGGVSPELDGIDALRGEDFGAAAEHFLLAAARYREMYVARMVRCTWFAGEALRLAGAPEAEETLMLAEEEAARRGMVPLRVRCERSLRALGVRRSAQVVRSAGSPLTEREHGVAVLAAAGLTDTQIGTRLGLQRRTVQTLLANARTKLGAETRAHLVRLVTEDAR